VKPLPRLFSGTRNGPSKEDGRPALPWSGRARPPGPPRRLCERPETITTRRSPRGRRINRIRYGYTRGDVRRVRAAASHETARFFPCPPASPCHARPLGEDGRRVARQKFQVRVPPHWDCPRRTDSPMRASLLCLGSEPLSHHRLNGGPCARSTTHGPLMADFRGFPFVTTKARTPPPTQSPPPRTYAPHQPKEKA